ncbi:MAG: DMT family transporter [Spirochaeta sp.]|nr:DMT family transporter [Spirochaeta sp.]
MSSPRPDLQALQSGMPATRLGVVYVQLLCAMMFFGLSFVFTSLALTELRPVSIIVVRLVISLAAMALLSRIPAVTRIVGGLQRPAGRDTRVFLLVALFQPFLYFLSENTGLMYAGPAVAAIIVATIPVVTPFFAFLVLREQITPLIIVSAFLSLAGVALIVYAGGEAGGAHPLGVLLIFGAVLAAVGYAIALRKMPSRYSSFTVVFWQNLIGLGLFLPVFLVLDVGATVAGGLPGRAVIGALVFLGLFPSTLSFIFLGRGIRVLGAVKANITTNTVPVFAALFSVLVLGEKLTPVMLLGMAIVIAGVLLSQLRRRPVRPDHTE